MPRYQNAVSALATEQIRAKVFPTKPMKPNRILLAALLGLSPLAAVSAAPAQADTRAEVAFLEPSKFTDVRDSHMGSDPERTGYLEQLREHIVARARYHVPAGHRLSVTFTDIDMAGDFEPWHGPRWDDIRVVKDIYPPRMELAFRLVDAEGNVVKEGRRELRDLAFMMKINMAGRSDPLRHEKALLDDWLRSEFPRVKKG